MNANNDKQERPNNDGVKAAPVERLVIPKTPDDFGCSFCGDEHYVLQGCCDGRECGCMGQPVSISVCIHCNHDGKKEMGEYTESYAQYVEFIEV